MKGELSFCSVSASVESEIYQVPKPMQITSQQINHLRTSALSGARFLLLETQPTTPV